MREYFRFLIGGRWIDPVELRPLDVINPADETVCGRIALGGAADVDRAVDAARAAFPAWSAVTRERRISVLQDIVAGYKARMAELAEALTEEMGAPAALAQRAQVPAGLGHFAAAADILATFAFEEDRGATRIVREPIGVCGFITPWNWPLNQIAAKIAPALATGCTMVLKPSEIAPFSGHILAEILHDAGVPAGVVNLVHGDGPGVGAALSGHPGIDMVSITGSTRAGIEVARNAAATVKRVHQELGGKGPHIVLDDDAFAGGVARGVGQVMSNSGQTCSAPTRMLVPAGRMAEAAAIARQAAEALTVGAPATSPNLGPVVSQAQFEKIQALIESGIRDGATLVAGGTGRPGGLNRGYYVRPTVFADVTNDMRIAREEIFGPVLSILGYDSLDHAVGIANDTEYGLSAYVSGADLDRARQVGSRLRAGQVIINGAYDPRAPFGGYKTSGNGREWGPMAFHEFLEVKAMLGWAAA